MIDYSSKGVAEYLQVMICNSLINSDMFSAKTVILLFSDSPLGVSVKECSILLVFYPCILDASTQLP